MCLLHVMHSFGYILIVSYFDHGLRPDSAADEEKVKAIAQKMGLDFESDREDVRAHANTQGRSIETEARLHRYAFLFRIAEKYRAQAVAVGHNADDQVETVLMHILRGAGLRGLSGMKMASYHSDWNPTLPLVRPLLNIWRAEILAYCEKHGLDPIFDPTNHDITFFRNRVRHELLAQLESYNPRVRAQLLRMAQTLSGDKEIIDQFIDGVWEKLLVEEQPDSLSFGRVDFLEEEPGVQRRLIRRALKKLNSGQRDIGFSMIARAIGVIQDPPTSGQSDVIPGLRLIIESDQFWLVGKEAKLPRAAEWPQTPLGQKTPIRVPGKYALGVHWGLRVEKVKGSNFDAKQLSQSDPSEAWLSADEIADSMTIRARLPGDRFTPLGMDGHSVKLSDFFINKKLHKRARDSWPLVCVGDEIAWIPGFHLSHSFRIRQTTKEILHFQLEHYDEQS